MQRKTLYFILLLIGLFAFRLTFGLFSEFWFDDELQIYLIGLKSYTTHTWPYFGPDIVYTYSQIPGALQGLLICIPLYIAKIPESPAIFLNILSFLSLSLFAWYISKKFNSISKWIIWIWVFTAPWVMNYSTRVVNPSYVLIFSIPFFVAFFETYLYKNSIIVKKYCLLIMGICTTLIMQLHMSWILLLPLIGLALFDFSAGNINAFLKNSAFVITGIVIGLLTLLPTYLQSDIYTKNIVANVVFNIDNFKNIPIVLMRYLSFATYEIPYMLGGNTHERLDVLYSYPWMIPFTIFVLVYGFFQVGLMVLAFFQKNSTIAWIKIKRILWISYLYIFVSFFFSIKGPSSHTFFVMLPIPMFYSFFCYEWLFGKKKIWRVLFIIALFSGIVFHTGLGLSNFKNKSLYKDRQKVQNAIDKKDYKLLDLRRADKWGYGY